MYIEKTLIALLSFRASDFSNIFIYFHCVMHKSGTKHLQSFVAFKRVEIGETHVPTTWVFFRVFQNRFRRAYLSLLH